MIDKGTWEMVGGLAEKAIREVSRDIDLTKQGDSDLFKNLVSIAFKADCKLEDDGYSQRAYSRNGEWYADGNYSRDGNMGNYGGGSSYRRGRSRYSRTDGYSRGSMMEHIDAMLMDAETEEEREKIRRFKEQMM